MTTVADSVDPVVPTPPLPPGARLALPHRGMTFYRHLPGPSGAPTVLLLHGWTATADLNWFRLYDTLGEHFRVIAPDHHGHGRGIRSRSVFRMEHVADDAVALCRSLGIHEALVVGYSMGGSIAQHVWRRHRSFTKGLVLAATAAEYADTDRERRRLQILRAIGIASRVVPDRVRDRVADAIYLSKKRGQWQPWAVQEITNHDWATIAQAGGDLGNFRAREWLHEIDVPTSVIVTTQDTIVPERRQRVLATGIRDAEVHEIAADHDACFAQADEFGDLLLGALRRIATNL